MTSVDSGVETGNDSNDSGQAETQSLILVSNTTLSDCKWEKLFSQNLAATFADMKKNFEDEQKQTQSDPGEIETDEASPTTIICRTNSAPLSSCFPINAGSSQSDTSGLSLAPQISLLTTLDFRVPRAWSARDKTNVTFSFAKISDTKWQLHNSYNKVKWHPRNGKFGTAKSRWYDAPYHGSTCERKMRLAAATNNIELMTHLLEKGVSPNNCDEQGRSPLHLACSRGYTDIVKLLLDYGADPNVTDTLGNTPLHLAAVTSKISVVTLLLKAGTNVLSSDRHGYNPLQLAQTKLRMLQNCKSSDMGKIKEEVNKVVGMLLAYLQKQEDVTEQLEALSSFCSRLSLSSTTDQVQDDVKDLLASIDSLSLTN